jgi:hypothetical protein
MIDVGLKTIVYLLPWLVTVALKPQLFFKQMTLQWQRLAVPNGWLQSVKSAIEAIHQGMGSPDSWPDIILSAGAGIWLLILAAFAVWIIAFGQYVAQWIKYKKLPTVDPVDAHSSGGVSLIPAAGWVIGAVWLWHNKPEVWFVYYLHLAVWTFTGLAMLKLWKIGKRLPLNAVSALTTAIVGISIYVNVTQANQLGKSETWKWSTYHDFVDCIDRVLSRVAETKKSGPFQVWAPTFPDITIELSRRHPDWDLSRTNDFHSRTDLAIQHGWQIDAMVVTETLGWVEKNIDDEWSKHPDVHSVWMDWKDYYLNRFMTSPGWKPNRYLCQRGRWQAFIFLN